VGKPIVLAAAGRLFTGAVDLILVDFCALKPNQIQVAVPRFPCHPLNHLTQLAESKFVQVTRFLGREALNPVPSEHIRPSNYFNFNEPAMVMAKGNTTICHCPAQVRLICRALTRKNGTRQAVDMIESFVTASTVLLTCADLAYDLGHSERRTSTSLASLTKRDHACDRLHESLISLSIVG
jgi:hypothetical protein